MSYRFNKNNTNSKNSSSNNRRSNYYRQDNDSNKSNFNDRRRANNKINRLSSDQVNQYSSDKESSERSKTNNQSISNYGESNRLERRSYNSAYRNSNPQTIKLVRLEEFLHLAPDIDTAISKLSA